MELSQTKIVPILNKRGFGGMFMLEWFGFVPTSGDFKIATRKPKLAFVF